MTQATTARDVQMGNSQGKTCNMDTYKIAVKCDNCGKTGEYENPDLLNP